MLLNKVTILKSGNVGNQGLAIFFGSGNIQIRNFSPHTKRPCFGLYGYQFLNF